MELPSVTLILGGAASGKSACAEALIGRMGREKVYIATAEPLDEEMRAKIEQHRKSRSAESWHTIEAPRDIVGALAGCGADRAILIDCLTLWMSNLMEDNADLEAETDRLLTTLDRAPGPIVLVSNELSGGLVPINKLGRAFQKAQGILNQRIAAHADLVLLVTAGLPMTLKTAGPYDALLSGTAC